MAAALLPVPNLSVLKCVCRGPLPLYSSLAYSQFSKRAISIETEVGGVGASCVRVKGGARFSLSNRAVDVDWDAGRACHLPVPHHGRARRFEARGAIAAVLGQIWRWVLPGVRRVDAGEAVRGRCLLDGCQHPSRVRGVRESRGSRLGLVLHCLARAAAAAGSPQLLGTPRR